MNKSFKFLIGGIGFVTIVFIALGFMFAKDEHEKQNGLTSIYDVLADGSIAYVAFEDGQPGIYFTGNEKPVVQKPVDKTILEISFSKDGKKLAYVVTKKEMSSESESAVHLLQLDTLEDRLLFQDTGLITELAFDPKDSEMLFYLHAATFTNYSPIAREHPHDFDVHSYHLGDQKRTKYTNLKKYSMRSLQVSPTDETVYVQMDDDANVQTAEDVYASRQRIFEIPLHAPDQQSVISNPVGEEDIYDFLLLPEREEIVYQAVAGTGPNGIFEYELFTFNWKTYETKQLTSLKEHTAKPRRGPDNRIYFLVDRNFGGREPVYQLYRMSEEGKDIEEVLLH
ncbi:hypothetical protein MHZ92_17650 [Sporosarcina sp. ACRSL]|uniref:hypothetical protein n=1 Tax=Sporosarcina sp. ACRSL TaxID=2918215 RepID=UPI001EF4D98F|nr:hypothetical protein [Sporosarcina sp. ACRSL]MCG7345940.1 hypothetical protein [Sporosarcina sp. ACRSL]